MCRLYGFVSNEPTKVDCSLVYSQNALMQQSRVDAAGLDHADGWGIATYENGCPIVFKKTTPAYQDHMFSNTAEKSYSRVVIAHVRKATVGNTAINNTHPFVYDRWTFAHNGTLRGFDVFKSELERETNPEYQALRKGETDSEQYFYWLMTRLNENGFGDLQDADPTALVKCLTDCVRDISNRCKKAEPEKTERLNFLLTDGHGILACRWNHTLNVIRRNGIYDCEICGIPHIHHNETVNHRAIAIASEPVTHEKWQEIQDHSVCFETI